VNPVTEPVIAVFGAAGKTGRAVVQALHDAGVGAPSIRQLVRAGTPPPHPLFTAGTTPVDLGDEVSLHGAVEGAHVLYVLAPNMHPDEPGLVGRAVSSAVRCGIRRVVYHSVLRPGLQAMPHHWGKLRGEELLWESGLEVTVLQPSAYTQNLAACIADGELVVPYSIDQPFSLVDLADVADAAARVLLEPGYVGATLELSGPVTTVRAVAEALDLRPRRHRAAPGTSGYAAEALEAMFDWYDRHGLPGNPAVLRWLLGREPRGAVEVLQT
jgi:uncharacterized protein YbjT (DUF2867 family)